MSGRTVPYGALLTRVADAASLMPTTERAGAGRVLEICQELVNRPRSADGRLEPGPDDARLRRDLSGLIETLGRRGSAAIPGASLARAALSDLHNDVHSRETAAEACELRLQLLGL